MIQRYVPKVICAALACALVTGCASTRMGSLPKFNWAWWKKKPDSPTARHDEALAAPSSTMSPVNALVKSDGAAPASAKTRKPYDTGMGPPEPRSFGADHALASGNTGATPDDLKFPVPDSQGQSAGNSQMPTPGQNVEATLDKMMANSQRKPFELSTPTDKNAPLDVSGTNSYVPGQAIGSNRPANGDSPNRPMMSNPYASGMAGQDATGSEPDPSTANPQYARTPYNEFTPKPSGSAGNVALNPLQPRSLGTQATPAATASPMAKGGATQSEIAQVSYTPGSTADSPSVNDLLAGAAPAATTNVVVPGTTPQSPNANPTTNPVDPVPQAPVKIGGGGSFRIVK